MKIDEIIELLTEWDNFKKINPQADIYDFGLWLTSKNNQSNSYNPSPIVKSGKPLTVEHSSNSQFLASYFINRMNKFVKIYTKEMFHNLGLNSVEDFSFLALIHQMDKPNKKELCEANLVEMTTGLDIIKRLLKNGLVTEVSDEIDKRVKRLIITPKGLEIVLKAYTGLQSLSQDVLGDLQEDEREIVIKFLSKLNNYHTKIVFPNK
jgi:DNA-binding MarR family transcriptional regulator